MLNFHTYPMIHFPDHFIWGSATAAHQIEGDDDNSMNSFLERQRGYKELSGKACDSWYLQKPLLIEAVKKSGRTDLVIVLENNTQSIALKQNHPELDIRIIGSILDKLQNTGENAAKAIVKYLETGQREKKG